MDILDNIDTDFDDDFELADVDDADFEGEVIEAGEMSAAKAQEITNAIRSAVAATHILISRAHEGKAWKALGYSTWKEYVAQEFEMSAQRSYQLLNLSNVVNEIEAVAPEGVEIKLTEAQARDIKRELPYITDQIRELPDDMDSDEAEARINEIVDEARKQKKLEDDAVMLKEKSVQEAKEEGYREGLEKAADAMLEQSGFDMSGGDDDDSEDGGFVEVEVSGESGLTPKKAMHLHNFFNVVAGMDALPEPDELIDIIPESKLHDLQEQISNAAGWINRFETLLEARNN